MAWGGWNKGLLDVPTYFEPLYLKGQPTERKVYSFKTMCEQSTWTLYVQWRFIKGLRLFQGFVPSS